MAEAAMSMIRTCPECGVRYFRGEFFCPVDAARLAVTPGTELNLGDHEDFLIGCLLSGRYQILERIGEGGMGLVYKARHVDIDRLVAIKVLRSDLSSNREVLARFHQEARSASRIGHDHIVSVTDFGTTPEGSSFFVMEHLEGVDLGRQMSEQRTMEEERAARMILQCCEALSAAHQKGIVHRDIKPENIVLIEHEGQRDFVKIVDFGIAKISDMDEAGQEGRKLTKTGMIFGTPEYMSPEQAGGRIFDHRVDIYALGVIFYESLTGRVPFVGDSFMAILSQHLSSEVPRLQKINPRCKVSKPMQAVIYKALEKFPENRFQNMDEFAEAIRQALQGRYSRATRAWKKAKATSRRVKVAVAVAAAIGLLSAIGLIYATSKKPAVEQPPDFGSRSATNSPTPVLAQPAAPSAAPEVISAIVELNVDSRPTGAKLFDAAGKPLCGVTPCTIAADRDRELTLIAKKGTLRGEATLTPDSDMEVQIALVRELSARERKAQKHHTFKVQAPKSQVGSSSTNDSAEPDSEAAKPAPTKQSGDLKVPDIFQ